eukprot:sb/3463979/
MEHIEGWPIGAFQAFISHTEQCAKAVPIGDQRQRIQSSLKSLFRAIDKDHSETLDRGHILTLIKDFYGAMPVNMKKYINNPLDWSDKDTVCSPTPTSLQCTTSQSIPITLPSPEPNPSEKPVEEEEEDGLTIGKNEEKEEEKPSSPPSAQEIVEPSESATPETSPATEEPPPQDITPPELDASQPDSHSEKGVENGVESPEKGVESPEKGVETPEQEDESPSTDQATEQDDQTDNHSQHSEPPFDFDGDADEQLKHDIELIGAVHPSPMSQARPVEIDPRLSIDQFLFVTEKLLGEDPHPRALTALSEFLEDSFQETPQQRQIRQLDEKLAAKRHSMLIKINDLFDEWDTDKLGFIDKTEMLAVLSQWQKTSTKSYNIEMSKQICEAVEKTDTKDILRDHFKTLCLSFHKLLDSDDFMDRLLNFVQLVVKCDTGCRHDSVNQGVLYYRVNPVPIIAWWTRRRALDQNRTLDLARGRPVCYHYTTPPTKRSSLRSSQTSHNSPLVRVP